MNLKWTEEQKKRLAQFYPVTESWEELQRLFPFSTKRGIQAAALRLGLIKPRISNSSCSHREDLFNIWTEESTYLLGYLEADGTFQFGSRSIRVTFAASQKDRKYLEKLKKLVSFTGKTTSKDHNIQGKTYRTYSFTVTSRKWDRQLCYLLRWNQIPPIPVELIHHYIRGYFDGDGSIFWSKQACNYHSSLVFSSRELADEFAKLLRPIVDSRLTIHKKTNAQCWYFNIAAEGTKKLGKFLYKDATIFLDRKEKRFNESVAPLRSDS